MLTCRGLSSEQNQGKPHLPKIEASKIMNARNDKMTATVEMERLPSEPVARATDIARRIVEGLSLHPECISSEEIQLGSTTMIRFQVHRGDMRRVIGAGGVNSKAMDAMVAVFGRREGKMMRLRFVEPEIGEVDKYGQFKAVVNWDREATERLINDIADAILIHKSKVQITDGDGGETVVDVETDAREHPATIQVLDGMAPIIKAIGKGKGRIITFNVVKADWHSSVISEEADRLAKERERLARERDELQKQRSLMERERKERTSEYQVSQDRKNDRSTPDPMDLRSFIKK